MAHSRNSNSSFDEPLPLGKMRCMGKGEIALKSATVNGTIEGLLFSSTIRQEYKNETDEALEIIYTFPIAWDTTLLGMKAQIGEKSLVASVVKKAEAEKKYEDAIDSGDAAIMVQESSLGLYTANLGNIKPGETVVIDIECAKLLSFDQGQIRLAIPTVIGKRYGDPHCLGGLAAHESDVVDPDARYPFRLALTLHGAIAEGVVSCPTHNAEIRKIKNGISVELESNAWLDRDFVLLIKGVSAESHALAAQDGENWMVSASFCPAMENVDTNALALKILVDCSGSMSGASIEQAKKGLKKILTLLSPRDRVSYSCFGNDVRHAEKVMVECTPQKMERLAQKIEATEADMGGTEMEKAILSTISSISADCKIQPVMLLITDGDIWEAKKLMSQAANSGHRIFVLGVGSAPAESVLMKLARITGGVCEFVTPNENMAGAVVRMFHRMRGKMASWIKVEWDEKPLWQSNLPRSIYDGETVHMFALLPEKPEHGPILSWNAGGEQFEAPIAQIDVSNNQTLVRMGRKRQMSETVKKEDRLQIALDYQLVSTLTSLILVHERAEEEKTKGLPKIQQVPQMPAHGHGCYADCNFSEMPAFMGGNLFASAFCNFGAPSLGMLNKLWKKGEVVESERHIEYVERIASLWQNNLFQMNALSDFIKIASSQSGLRNIVELLKKTAANFTLPEEQVWAVFIDWALHTVGQATERHTRRLLKNWLDDEAETDLLREEFDRWLNPELAA